MHGAHSPAWQTPVPPSSGQAVPSGRSPVPLHTGAPLEHSIAYALHAAPPCAVQAAPSTHGAQPPCPSQTWPAPHEVPGGACAFETQRGGPPSGHSSVPVLHVLSETHAAPAPGQAGAPSGAAAASGAAASPVAASSATF